VIGPAGIFVIDTKLYAGKIERRRWFPSRDERLFVKGSDRTGLVEGMARQVDAVRKALGATAHPDCRVVPVLCFVESHWGVWGRPFLIGDVRVLWPKMLGKLVRREGPLERDDIAALEWSLCAVLPSA
jgi:hypothetical protein